MLLASITQSTFEEARREMERARPFAQGFEFRLDCLKDLSGLESLVRSAELPVMFTFGNIVPSEEILSLSPDFCDVPAEHFGAAQKFPHFHWVGSYHNFDETPVDLARCLEKMKNPHFHSYKIAVKARSTLDMLRLMAFKKGCSEPLTAIAMGEYGRPSRILGKAAGNLFHYASSVDEPELGRYSLEELEKIFHFSKINGETELFGLIGDPIESSIGHLYHNQEFRKKGRNAVYVKLRVKSEELPQLFSYVTDFKGFSITMPLKEALFPDRAVNTIFRVNGRWEGFNTDGIGALNAIERHFEVRGKRIALLGAGGAARAIAHEAQRRGGVVSLYNRTVERAKRLAAALGCSGHGLEELKDYDLLINTIPCRLNIQPEAPTFDAVYRPKETPLLQAAKRRGHLCIYGEEFFYEQARLQQAIWDGH